MTGDTVVVPRIDRLARNLTEGLKTIEELHAQGIHIRALAEGLDTGDDSPSSRLMLHMLLSLAEWERDTIRDRIRAGVDRAAAEGRTGGRTLDGRGERHRGSQQRAGAVPATVQSTLPSSSAIPRTCIPASQPGAVPGTGPCLKHSRRVARDNTVRFQLLPGPERPSYAGAAVEVLEGLDGRLLVRHEGRIVAAQEAPPSPVFSPKRPRAFRTCSCPTLRCQRPGRTLDRDSQTTGHKGSGREGSSGQHRQRSHRQQAQSHLSAQADVP